MEDIIILIKKYIKENNEKEITGEILQQVLVKILEQPNKLIGNTEGLATHNKVLVNSINEIIDSIPGDVTAVEKRLRKLEQKTAIFELNGGVIPYAGTVEDLPKGWVLCDGSNNTPDLRGKFIVGQDPESEDYDTVGKTGGVEKVTLTIPEMPNHTHVGNTYSTGEHTHPFTSIRWVKNGSSYGSGSNAEYFVDYTQKAGNHFHGFKTNEVGGSQAHENRPPYYVLAYIMFIG